MGRLFQCGSAYASLCGGAALLIASAAWAAAPAVPIPADLPEAAYHVEVSPQNIAATPATVESGTVNVEGQARKADGHPCTLWDKQDIAEIKARLETDPAAKKALDDLKAKADARIAKELNVPIAQKGSDGKPIYPGDFAADVPPFKKVSATNESNAKDIALLGTAYALTGDEKYGEFARRMIVAYADNYGGYGHPAKWTYRSAIDGRLTGQFLEDGFWLQAVAFGTDLIHDLPSFTQAQRDHVRDDLFRPIVAEFAAMADEKRDYFSALHNRAATAAAASLTAGYAVDDEQTVTTALYGVNGSAQNPTGGLIGTHFSEKCIYPDGLWNEGAPAYQIGIATSALMNAAETLWHHDIDLYRHRNGALKRLLDAPLALAYPDDKLSVAALHDSARTELLDDRAWFNNEAGIGYEYGYRRYRDPRYIPIINNAAKSFELTVHNGPPSLFQDISTEAPPKRPIESVNFYNAGYGVLRTAGVDGKPNQALMEYGSALVGHSHPSKLGIDVYALGDVLMPMPGVIFPYNDPLDAAWYWSTPANNIVAIDESPQKHGGNAWTFPRGSADPVAPQLVFLPGKTIGIQRAWTNTSHPGATEDRSIFLTSQYVVDLYFAGGTTSHTFDYCSHFRGELTANLPMKPFSFGEKAQPGYKALTEVQSGTADRAFSAEVTTPAGAKVHFFLPAAGSTQVITGKGHFYLKNPKQSETPATIILRRTGETSTLFGSAVDISGGAFVKGVEQSGSLEKGYGLLNVTTADGSDVCFTAFRPGSYSAGDVKTDGLQAYVRTSGGKVTAMSLGGGKSLEFKDASITRSTPGLALVETTDEGVVVVNPSPEEATITVSLPGSAKFSETLKGGESKTIGK